MSNKSIVVIGGVVALLIPQIAQAGDAPIVAGTSAELGMRSVSVEFPASDRTFPPGPNADLVTNNCTACHSAGMILTQPKLTTATWTAEVNKMRATYKATVADEDVPQIVAYLAAMPVGQ